MLTRMRRFPTALTLTLAMVALAGCMADAPVVEVPPSQEAAGTKSDGEPTAGPTQREGIAATLGPDEPGNGQEATAPAATGAAETEQPGAPNSTPPPAAESDEEPARVVFPYGTYLFVEIVEERVLKSDSGGQTTSFAGDQQSYDFDPERGTLEGLVKGRPGEAALTVVGRLVITQIDRSKAEVGQLYVFAPTTHTFGLVTIEMVSADGSVFLVLDGQSAVLAPGESVLGESEGRGGDDRTALSSASRSVSVTNHGFLLRSGLTLTEP